MATDMLVISHWQVLPGDAMLAQYVLWPYVLCLFVCLSDCSSVRLSQVGVLSIRLKVGSRKQSRIWEPWGLVFSRQRQWRNSTNNDCIKWN